MEYMYQIIRNLNKVFIVADDLGLHEKINEGIIYLLRSSRINGTSLMANGEAFDDAVGRLRGLENLSIGVHLTLVEEKPVLSRERVPSLIDGQGNLHKNYASFFRRYITGKIRKAEIERELRAQIEKCFKSGIKPSFLNSHQHLHLLPGVIDIVIKLAREYNIRYIRIINNPFNLKSGRLFRKVSLTVLKILSVMAKRKINKSGLISNDIFIGFINAGNLSGEDIKIAVELANRHPGKIIELGCNPGFEDESLKIKYKNWGNYNWEKEFKALQGWV